MAKKTTAKQNTNNGESKFKGIRNFFTSERTRLLPDWLFPLLPYM